MRGLVMQDSLEDPAQYVHSQAAAMAAASHAAAAATAAAAADRKTSRR